MSQVIIIKSIKRNWEVIPTSMIDLVEVLKGGEAEVAAMKSCWGTSWEEMVELMTNTQEECQVCFQTFSAFSRYSSLEHVFLILSACLPHKFMAADAVLRLTCGCKTDHQQRFSELSWVTARDCQTQLIVQVR